MIHYGAGDNNLARFIFSNTDELEKVGSDVNTHVVSILDVGKQWGAPFKGARVFYLQKDAQSGKINSPIVKNLGQINSADPQVMANLIKEVIRKFPAENIAIFIDGHGVGWEGTVVDNSSGSEFMVMSEYMVMSEIREALEKISKELSRKIDVLAFASPMAMVEVGYELKDAVKYIVASQQLELLKGYSYIKSFSKAMVDSIQKIQENNLLDIKFGAEEFIKSIVNAANKYIYRIQTISAVDLDKIQELVNALDLFAQKVLEKIKENKATVDAIRIYDLVKYTMPSWESFADLKRFMELIIKDETISHDIRHKARLVIDSLNNYVITEKHAVYPYSNGVSIELTLCGGVLPDYEETLFAKDTKWDEMLKEIIRIYCSQRCQ
ncbi:MAG: clostripain-related cysteine peptidase [Candidatus Methanomethylicaceae archaeon]